MLKDTVRQDMYTAMKEGPFNKRVTLSLLLSALLAKEKDKKEPLTSEEEIEVVAKMVKQLRDSLEIKGLTFEFKRDVNREIDTYLEYLPKQLTEEEVEKIVRETVFQMFNGSSFSVKDKGAIMKVIIPELKGKADGKLINKVVEDLLAR